MAKTIKKASKKASLDSMQQIDGALAPSRSVAEMFGDDTQYTVDNVNDYMKQIKAMSEADLHDHSVKIGVTPISFRDRLEDRLERHFLVTQSKKTWQPQIVQFSPEAMERQKRLMRGGF